MANTSRMLWALPDENDKAWYAKFNAMVNAQDASAYAAREDRSLVLSGGGTITFNSGTGVLTWSAAIDCLSPITGFKGTIAAGSVTLVDGQAFYVDITRGMVANATLTASVAASIPNNDTAIAIAVRNGGYVYFRNGARLAGGDSKELYATAGITGLVIEDEGSVVAGGPHTRINFAGSGVSVANAGSGEATVTITSGGLVIEDEGSVVSGGPHTRINFAGAGVSVADAGSGEATVTISGGGGGGSVFSSSLSATSEYYDDLHNLSGLTTLKSAGGTGTVEALSGYDLVTPNLWAGAASINVPSGEWVAVNGCNSEPCTSIGATGDLTMNWRIAHWNFFDSTYDYEIRVGMLDRFDPDGAANGIGFVCNYALFGNLNWHAVLRINSADLSNCIYDDTGVLAHNGTSVPWYNLSATYDASAAETTFSINGVTVSTIAQSLSGYAMGPVMTIKPIDVVAVQMLIDYMHFTKEVAR